MSVCLQNMYSVSDYQARDVKTVKTIIPPALEHTMGDRTQSDYVSTASEHHMGPAQLSLICWQTHT